MRHNFILSVSLFAFAIALSTTHNSSAQETKALITVERLKLIELTALRVSATPSNINTYVAVPLRLTQSGPLITKQLGGTTDDGAMHVFAAPDPPIGKYVLIHQKGHTIHVFALDSNAKLLAAGVVINKAFTSISLEAASSIYDAELKYWSAGELPK